MLDRPDSEIAAFGRRAEQLRRRFDGAFFDEALGTYVLALDGDKRPCRVRSSNAGHALLTGIARPDRAEASGARPDAAVLLHRLGHPDDRDDRGALQPDKLSQRLGLAARQRADRPGHVELRLPRRGRPDPRRPLRGLDLHRPQAAARALLRLPAAPQPRPHLLSGRLLAAGLGRRRDALAHPVVPRARLRSRQRAGPVRSAAAPGLRRHPHPAAALAAPGPARHRAGEGGGPGRGAPDRAQGPGLGAGPRPEPTRVGAPGRPGSSPPCRRDSPPSAPPGRSASRPIRGSSSARRPRPPRSARA